MEVNFRPDMTNFLLRMMTGFVLVAGVGFVFLGLPTTAFTILLLAILLEILVLEWPKLAGKNIWLWLFALIYLVLPVYLLILLNQAAEFKLLGLLLVVVPAFDMGAYLVGKTLGRYKLCPSVSPNKTWEGVGGGFAGVLVVLLITTSCNFTNLGLILTKFNNGLIYNPCVKSSLLAGLARSAHLLFLAIIITVLATLGDLFESWLKRRVDLKDSGSLLPGHGGFLDRIDAIIFVTFFFYFFKNFIVTVIFRSF